MAETVRELVVRLVRCGRLEWRTRKGVPRGFWVPDFGCPISLLDYAPSPLGNRNTDAQHRRIRTSVGPPGALSCVGEGTGVLVRADGSLGMLAPLCPRSFGSPPAPATLHQLPSSVARCPVHHFFDASGFALW